MRLPSESRMSPCYYYKISVILFNLVILQIQWIQICRKSQKKIYKSHKQRCRKIVLRTFPAPLKHGIENMKTVPRQLNLWDKYREEYRSLFRLGLPVLVTQLGVIVVSFADTMMVGAYGVDELAAAAFVNSLFVIIVVMQMGFAMGITPLVGALFGRGEKAEAGRTLHAGLQVNVFVSTAFTVLMGTLYFFLDRFGQPEELLPLIRQYYLIILATLLPMSVFNSFQQTCNGFNDTAMPMWMILGANVINIIGNYALIFGHFGMPEMGLAGAGLSTLVARYSAAIVLTFVFFYARRYRPYTRGFRIKGPHGAIRRRIWTTSYPVMVQSGIECLLWSVGAIVCGWYGKIQLAAFQVVNTMAQLGFMTYISFGTATSIRVANYMGVKDYRGVRRITMAGLHLNLLLATLASAIFYLAGHWIIGCFTPDAYVIASAMTLVLPLIIYQYMDAVQYTYCNAIRGTSFVKPLLWIAVLAYLVLGIPVLFLLAKAMDLENVGVYYSFDVALMGAALFATVIFYRMMRRIEGGSLVAIR